MGVCSMTEALRRLGAQDELGPDPFATPLRPLAPPADPQSRFTPFGDPASLPDPAKGLTWPRH